ncbi:type II secretion system protein M [Vibrio salinus]|uniref:type II secretion system protein M n=1 Tax=Vibrio salinus TaxID=2899784 RepID=UPI001E5D4AD1|nr:type II secretion system protein M [Vibrio salinus]MCE0493862.1 type II secretion system protein M [Vibrio salinus]
MKQVFPRIKNWWFALSTREQKLMVVMAVIVIVFFAYAGIWRPIYQGAEEARSRLVSEQKLLSWVKNHANQIISLRQTSGQSATKDMPFNQVITTSSKQYGLTLIRIQPRENSYQVWFEPASFNRFLKFIDYLQRQYGIRVEALDVEKAKQPGLIEIKRLQMSLGSMQ